MLPKKLRLYKTKIRFIKVVLVSHLDVGGLIEPVHLVEQLKEDSLHLAVSAGLSVESLGRDGVDLIDEDDRGTVLLRQTEHVANL